MTSCLGDNKKVSSDAADQTQQIRQLDAFLEGAAEGLCAWQFRCCSLPEIDAIGGSSYLTEAECRSFAALALHEWSADVRSALNQGHLSFDPTVGDACIGWLKSAACNRPDLVLDSLLSAWGRFAQCPDPFLGKEITGSRCFLTDECESGNACRSSGFTGTDGGTDPQAITSNIAATPTIGDIRGTVGVCYPRQKSGDRCAQTEECAAGLYCRRTDFVCALPATEGQPCDTARDASGVAIGLPVIVCAETPKPLACVANICRRLPRDGEPCLQPIFSTFPPCDPSVELALSCVGQDFNGTGVCKKNGARGDVCGGSGLPPCQAPLSCAASENSIGTCDTASAAGQRCPFDGRCEPMAVCYAGTNTCVVPPANRAGRPCLSDVDCASLFCVPTDFTGGPGVCIGGAEVGTPAICSGIATFGGGSNPPPIVDGQGGVGGQTVTGGPSGTGGQAGGRGGQAGRSGQGGQMGSAGREVQPTATGTGGI